jgi:hypothetical protein
VSLLTEGLVARGVDVTLFATADSVTTARLVGTAPTGYSEDPPSTRRSGRPSRGDGGRARRRPRPAPQQRGLPAADVLAARRHADGHHDPRVRLRGDAARLSRRTRIAAPTSRSATPTGTRRCPTRRPSTTASTSDVRAACRGRAPPRLLRADPPRQGHGRRHRRALARAGMPLSSPASSRTRRTSTRRRAEDRRLRVTYLGSVGPAERQEVLGDAIALLHLIDFDEPFGFSVVEAMACGTPVIATREGRCRS